MTVIIVLMFVVFLFSAFEAFGIGNFGVTYVDLLAMILYGVFLFKVVFKNIRLELPQHILTYVFFLFWISALLSSLTLFVELPRDRIMQFFKTFSHFSFVIFLFVIVLTYDFDNKLIRYVVKCWLVLSVVINLFGIYQIIARAFDLPLAWISITNSGLSMRGTLDMGGKDTFEQLSLQFGNFYRATSVFSEPSMLAQFNLYILIFILIPYLQKMKPFFRSKLLNGLIVVCAVTSLFLTFSLTAMVGCLMIVMLIMILESRSVRKKILLIVCATAIIITPINFIIQGVTGISVFNLFGQRLSGIIYKHDRMEEGIVGESFHTRFNSIETGLRIWEKSPLIGSGLGLTQFDQDAAEAEIVFFDSSIVSVLSETGALGAIFFTAFFVVLFVTSIKAFGDVKNKKIGDEEFSRLLGMNPYIMLILIEANFISANSVISWNLWLVALLVFVPAIKYIKNCSKVINFRFSNDHFLSVVKKAK